MAGVFLVEKIEKEKMLIDNTHMRIYNEAK